ncbi:hypothetical protein E2562_019338 [Oryza meyeriana var. granulata]|uniref:Uncharacterized protein n=1 Tax=Oryza meyeriana var. granulata TaxID=110450 RepID=A0A6G1BM68_9ORYZ|nr:hypothetical protein E2562_019338 [Oryza meyeriana var. granulata]
MTRPSRPAPSPCASLHRTDRGRVIPRRSYVEVGPQPAAQHCAPLLCDGVHTVPVLSAAPWTRLDDHLVTTVRRTAPHPVAGVSTTRIALGTHCLLGRMDDAQHRPSHHRSPPHQPAPPLIAAHSTVAALARYLARPPLPPMVA